MKEKINLTLITRGATRCLALILAVLIPTMPRLLKWYTTVRTLNDNERLAITVAFYICAVIVAFALWQMEKLLKNLLAKQVFLREMSAVSGVSGGAAPGSAWYVCLRR